MDEHTKGLKRRISDRELRTSEAQRLRELASECAVEPADPSICDACAAYLILSETTDLEDQFQTGFNEGRPQGSTGDEAAKIARINQTGEDLVETVDPGGFYNRYDTTGITNLYHRAREFVAAIDDLGFIPVQLERRLGQ